MNQLSAVGNKSYNEGILNAFLYYYQNLDIREDLELLIIGEQYVFSEILYRSYCEFLAEQEFDDTVGDFENSEVHDALYSIIVENVEEYVLNEPNEYFIHLQRIILDILDDYRLFAKLGDTLINQPMKGCW